MNAARPIPRFAVIGHPVAHSRSPSIHAAFSAQTGIALEYGLLPCEPSQFESTVTEFFKLGGCGLNVTVPFKERAWDMAQHLSQRAKVAGAVNTLWQADGTLHGCNTDGVGLLSDLQRLGFDPNGARILLIGAGGASKGVVEPLLEAGCIRLHIVNRTPERAQALSAHMKQALPQHAERLSHGNLHQGAGTWDIVINATSGSLQGAVPAIDGLRYAGKSLAYDMFYAAQPTAFMSQAKSEGASATADGLGMLVGQAAESFRIWHGVTPAIAPVLDALRRALSAA